MEMTIPAMLGETVRRYERKLAFQMKIGREYKGLTYGELDQQARAFGSGLIAFGLRPGDRGERHHAGARAPMQEAGEG